MRNKPISIAIKTSHPIHLEIQRRNTTPVGILRTTFRDPVTGAVRHSTHGRLTGLGLESLILIQAAIRGEVILKSDPDALRTTRSLEYGAKPALEWVMERQSVTTDKASGITNDANLWATETMGNPKYP
ncbi:MAG: hypothetical protein K9N23_18510 [Akkermansiaceae bacterium]|nr:hypothetical protein [Akkermansiaceae bacterium]MCF7733687.1 hypothetical protein [Akkermansiaceae bacterium]